MKKIRLFILMSVFMTSLAACGSDVPQPVIPGGDSSDNTETPADSKILVAYFSWGGTTKRMAQQIAELTGGTLFEIEPVNPYPTEYTPCTEVAREERDSDARPAIKGSVEDMDSYDIVFIGCPVWWHEEPAVIRTFLDDYRNELKGKVIFPFCTSYESPMSEADSTLHKGYPDLDIKQGLRLPAKEEVIKKWLKQ